MNQVRHRRVVKLEQQGERFFEAIRQVKTQLFKPTGDAVTHAINLGCLLIGDPKIGEPLSSAWQRFLEKYVGVGPGPCRFPPFRDKLDTTLAARFNRELIVPPDANEAETFIAIFAAAPPWLLWFTHADFTAQVLGIKPPDLSSVAGFVRSEATFKRWPVFPDGMFEPQPWPGGLDTEPLTASEIKLHRDSILLLNDQMTPRERQRAFDIYVKYGDGRKK
jgi:hypothetical protein